MTDETAQPSKPVEYTLEPGERAVLQAYYSAFTSAKARIFDLQVTLEQAQEDLRRTQHAYNGAVGLLASSHGIANGGVTPDFARIIPR